MEPIEGSKRRRFVTGTHKCADVADWLIYDDVCAPIGYDGVHSGGNYQWHDVPHYRRTTADHSRSHRSAARL